MKKRGIYDPSSGQSFKLSRSKIELYCNCPFCFYLDRRLSISPPPGFPFNLNNAVDTLLKKEFDSYREKKEPHPLMSYHGIDAIPFQHENLDEWRQNFKGITYLHPPTQFLVTGAVDEIWINRNKELMVVDFKATSKATEINLDAEWQDGYKRQMEVYQWLLRMNGFKVSNTGYFLYCNGKKDRDTFDSRLEFDISVLPYVGDDSWIDQKLHEIFMCLNSDQTPDSSAACDLCKYRKSALELSTKNEKNQLNLLEIK